MILPQAQFPIPHYPKFEALWVGDWCLVLLPFNILIRIPELGVIASVNSHLASFIWQVCFYLFMHLFSLQWVTTTVPSLTMFSTWYCEHVGTLCLWLVCALHWDIGVCGVLNVNSIRLLDSLLSMLTVWGLRGYTDMGSWFIVIMVSWHGEDGSSSVSNIPIWSQI